MSSEITYQVFITLVVPLNKYSKQDLIEKNDELSLIFLINQLQNSSEFHALKDIPKKYTEHLTENTPDYLLKIIGKVIAVLLHKLNIPDEEVYEVTDQTTRRKGKGLRRKRRLKSFPRWNPMKNCFPCA